MFVSKWVALSKKKLSSRLFGQQNCVKETAAQLHSSLQYLLHNINIQMWKGYRDKVRNVRNVKLQIKL